MPSASPYGKRCSLSTGAPIQPEELMHYWVNNVIGMTSEKTWRSSNEAVFQIEHYVQLCATLWAIIYTRSSVSLIFGISEYKYGFCACSGWTLNVRRQAGSHNSLVEFRIIPINHRKTKLVQTIFKNSVRTSKRTPHSPLQILTG
jgi:hypothetical protein